MGIGELLDNLGLLDTGDDALARETLEAFSKRDDFAPRRDDTLDLLNWKLNFYRDLLKHPELQRLSPSLFQEWQECFDRLERERAFLAAL